MMGLLNLFRRGEPEAAASVPVRAMAGEAATFTSFDDPDFMEFVRGGAGAVTEAGAVISVKSAMKNTTVLRCVSLISRSIGMLPFHIRDRETKEKATDHPLFALIYRKPNAWQNALQFRVMMQQNALTHGDAFALIVLVCPERVVRIRS
ncbi:phage portal protein [Frigidibacter sp. MR17.14]|uniref:phage portal protein n=1 Tax=Frigidibacter sp. MR17.14 TaxID=3126509 RepID=UPI003013027A